MLTMSKNYEKDGMENGKGKGGKGERDGRV
jgi:hypothetical protein